MWVVKMVLGLRENEYELQLKEMGINTLEERRYAIKLTCRGAQDNPRAQNLVREGGQCCTRTRSGSDPFNIKTKTGGGLKLGDSFSQ
jgi:hypothetical protein